MNRLENWACESPHFFRNRAMLSHAWSCQIKSNSRALRDRFAGCQSSSRGSPLINNPARLLFTDSFSSITPAMELRDIDAQFPARNRNRAEKLRVTYAACDLTEFFRGARARWH